MAKYEEGYAFAKLKGPENFEQWSNNMRGALLAVDLWGFIDAPNLRKVPPELKSTPDDDEDRQEKIWERNERRAKYFGQQNSCIGKIYRQCTFSIQQILDSNVTHPGGVTQSSANWTPKILWDTITELCTEKGWGIKWGLINRLSDTVLRGDNEQEANQLLSRCLDLQQKIESHKMTVNELLSIMVLNQLPQQFDTIKKIKRHGAKTGNKVPTIQEIIEDVKDDMRNRHMNQNIVNFAGNNNKAGKDKENKGKGQGKGKGKGDLNTPRCTYAPCGKSGHEEKNCIKKYPERANQILKEAREAKEKRQKDKEASKPKDSDSSTDDKKKGAWDVFCAMKASAQDLSLTLMQDSAFARELQRLIEERASGNSTTVNRVDVEAVWHAIIDSGAQQGIFTNRELLHDYEAQEDFCRTGSGEVLHCPGKGTAIFNLEGPDGIIRWSVSNILWCPQLGHNLLGTVPLGKNGISVLLKPEGEPSELQKVGACFGYADLIGNQYVLRAQAIEKDAVQACVIVTPAQLHQRMGHLNWASVNEVPKFSTGIELQGKSKPAEVCGPCMKGHQRLKISHSPMPKATRPLQFIHSDLGGPYPMTRGRNRYYISFLDDFTGCTWTYLLKHKSEAFATFKQFKAMVENQSDGLKIAFLRSDRGGEYIDHGFQEFLKDSGIKWEPTAAYTQNQNGKAERLNYTLMSMVRSMRSYAKLPTTLWGELLKTAVYLRNRSPHGNKRSSYEALQGTPPDLSHLKIVGSRAWVHIPKELRTKVQDRSWQGILVGYEGSSNYRIYDPTKGTITVTRTVTIDEKSLYNKSQNSTDAELVDEEWRDDVDELADPNEEDETPHYSASQPNSGAPKPSYQPLTPEATPAPEQPPTNQSGGHTGNAPPVGDDDDDENENQGPLDPPHQIAPRRSGRIQTLQKQKGTVDRFNDDYYDPTKPISRLAAASKTPKDANILRTPKSHRHMVQVLTMLSNGIDDAGDDEPQSLKEAMKSSSWPHWLEAMKIELKSLIENETWDLVDPPANRSVLTGRWVFKLKKDRHGQILKYKARWVVHGYKQRYGLDYEETFASVAKPMSWKALMALAALRGLKIRQLDVVTAFLYGFLDQMIFVEQPHILSEGIKVCLLRRALYGLKQSPRVWFETIADFLKKLGLLPSAYDPAIFISDDKEVFVSIYVDDLLIFGSSDQQIAKLTQQLSERFKMTDLGTVSHYLGMEIDVTGAAVSLRQTTYLKKVLERFQINNCKTRSTPMDPDFPARCMPSDEQADQDTITWYQSAIGSLMWPAIHTRPDFLYAVTMLAKYNNNPGPLHIRAVRQVFQYVAGTLERGIQFCKDGSSQLAAYSDSDWAGQIDGRKSTGGFAFMLAGGPVSHSSKQQPIVALSSTEAELIALNEAGKEAKWLGHLLDEFSLNDSTNSTPVHLKGDNQGSIALTQNPEHHKRTKHIDIRYHWIREAVSQGCFSIDYVPTKLMVADGLTKPLGPQSFSEFVRMLGMCNARKAGRGADAADSGG